jgi:Phage integrase, N-terminal SAM-like domain
MTPLRQRMTEDMQVRNLALNTQTSYVQQVSLFARYFNKSPEQLGPEDIRTYQVYLTNEKKLAPGSVLIAVAALRFLYKTSLKRDWPFEDVIPAPKKPQTLPVVLSPEEVLHSSWIVHCCVHQQAPGKCQRQAVAPLQAARKREYRAGDLVAITLRCPSFWRFVGKHLAVEHPLVLAQIVPVVLIPDPHAFVLPSRGRDWRPGHVLGIPLSPPFGVGLPFEQLR